MMTKDEAVKLTNDSFEHKRLQKLYIEDCNHKTAIDRRLLKICNFVYAYGKLEEKAKYDIVTFIGKFDYTTDRTEEVIAVLSSGEEIPSRLFFWHSVPHNETAAYYAKQDPIYLCHGLICDLTDIEALEDAQIKFDERRSDIWEDLN